MEGVAAGYGRQQRRVQGVQRDAMAAWAERLAGVRGVLLDISGVLYDSGAGGGAAIAGSVEAVARLKRSPLKVRFCTNESQKSRRELVGLLQRLGFDISEGEVTAPAPATCQILKERGLRPHLLVHDGVRSEFDDIDMSNPNCVVIADAGESFSYKNMNRAFQVLMELENPVLISLGKGRYYKETSGLMLDVGGYMKALEVPTMVCPMPSSGFLEKRERFTYKKPFMCRVSSRTLPPLWSWLSHCLGHHTVTCVSFSHSSPGQPPGRFSQHALYHSSLTPGCLLPGPVNTSGLMCPFWPHS